jgi:hypothetical protein
MLKAGLLGKQPLCFNAVKIVNSDKLHTYLIVQKCTRKKNSVVMNVIFDVA